MPQPASRRRSRWAIVMRGSRTSGPAGHRPAGPHRGIRSSSSRPFNKLQLQTPMGGVHPAIAHVRVLVKAEWLQRDLRRRLKLASSMQAVRARRSTSCSTRWRYRSDVAGGGGSSQGLWITPGCSAWPVHGNPMRTSAQYFTLRKLQGVFFPLCTPATGCCRSTQSCSLQPRQPVQLPQPPLLLSLLVGRRRQHLLRQLCPSRHSIARRQLAVAQAHALP